MSERSDTSRMGSEAARGKSRLANFSRESRASIPLDEQLRFRVGGESDNGR